MADGPTKRARTSSSNPQANRLPDVEWLPLEHAFAWLATGHIEPARVLPADKAEAAHAWQSAWRFLFNAGRAGKVRFSGIPWDSRASLSMKPHLGRQVSGAQVEIDSRCFSKKSAGCRE